MMSKSYRNGVFSLFSLDLRSLAVLRILIAVILILDLVTKVTSIVDFYSDKGVFARADLAQIYPWERFSLNSISGSVEWQLLLFLATLIFALMFLVGYKTKLANIALFILLVSLFHRNPFTDMGSTVFVRLILFWGIFIPWNARFSLDASKSSTLKKLPDKILTIGTVGYIFQICVIYLFSGLAKTGVEWTTNFSAIYYALNSNIFATSFVKLIPKFTENVLKTLTPAVRWFEISVPILIFFPYRNDYIRLILIILLVYMHINFGIFLNLGLFPIVNIVILAGLIPSFVWDRLLGRSLKSNGKNRVDHRMFEFSRIANIFGLLAIIYMFFINIHSLNWGFRLPKNIATAGLVLGINQKWDFFAPSPPLYNIWPQIIGVSKNGEKVVLLNSINGKSNNKYFTNNLVWRNFITYRVLRRYRAKDVNVQTMYAKFLCRKWNMASIGINFLAQKIALPNDKPHKIQLVRVLDHKCK